MLSYGTGYGTIYFMNEMAKQFLLKRRKRIIILIYFFIYLFFFYLIEHVIIQPHYHMLDTPLDHMIPFIPPFVLAYYFWFGYHVWGMLPAFIDSDESEYYRIALSLFSGMTVFIIVSIIFPNGQALRPAHLGRDIFSRMVGAVYASDTPTNIMPSIHVYNALMVNTAICRRSKSHHPALSVLSVFCCVMIILSTLFIKQHTIADIIGSFIMYIIFYYIYYRRFHVPSFLKDPDVG